MFTFSLGFGFAAIISNQSWQCRGADGLSMIGSSSSSPSEVPREKILGESNRYAHVFLGRGWRVIHV